MKKARTSDNAKNYSEDSLKVCRKQKIYNDIADLSQTTYNNKEGI